MKSLIITVAALLTLTAISFTSISCSDSCNPTTAEIESLKPMVASITVGYEDGTIIELTPDSAHFNDVCDEVLHIALSIDSKCDCIAFFHTVEQLVNREFVYVFFSQPVEITTCIYVPEERQEGITADENGYRIISATEVVILPQESLPYMWADCEEWGDTTVCGMWESARSMDKVNNLIDELAGISPDVNNVEFSLETTDMPSATSMMTYKIENPSITADYVEEIGGKMGFTGTAGYIDDNSKLSMIQEEEGQVKQLSVWVGSGALEYYLHVPDLLFPSSAPILPSYDEAIAIATGFLESNGLLPSGINADEATVETGGTYGSESIDAGQTMGHERKAGAETEGTYGNESIETGELIEGYDTHLLVRFPRSINNVEIAGPGEQVEVRVGDGGVIAQALIFHRQITPDKELEVKSSTEAYNDLTAGKGSYNMLLDCKSVIVKDVSFVYWMEPVDSDQEYLVPIYMFEGDCLDDSGEYLYPFVGYCQATK